MLKVCKPRADRTHMSITPAHLYVTNGPCDSARVSIPDYGAARVEIEVQCPDCEQVYNAIWEKAEINSAAQEVIDSVPARYGIVDISLEEANQLLELLPVRGHTVRDCIAFVRDLAVGRAKPREQPVEPIDW